MHIGIAIGIMMLGSLPAFGAGASAITVNASGGGDYTNIQYSIDNASAGDTILVYSGIYHENVNITKKVILRGIGNPVVDAAGNGSAITLSVNGIILEGFTMTGSGDEREAGIMVNSNRNMLSANNIRYYKYGITLSSSNNNSISKNNVSNNRIGIYMESSDNNNLGGNNASNNDISIYLSSSGNNRLSKNIVSKNNIGIFVWNSSSNILSRNIALKNYYGIYLSNSGKNTINSTKASNNDVGIILEDSRNNKLGVNNASKDYYGIYLESSDNNKLSGNNAYDNEYGIYLESSGNNKLSGNKASNNYYGIYLVWYSDNNTIYDNYFNNANNAYDDGKNMWNINKTPGINIIRGAFIGGNFWSDYSGKDTDGNGLGDTNVPYNSSTGIAKGGDYLPLTPLERFAININIDQDT